ILCGHQCARWSTPACEAGVALQWHLVVDRTGASRQCGIRRERSRRCEIAVAFDRQGQAAAEGRELRGLNIAELGRPKAEIAQAEGGVTISRVELREQPSRVGVRRKEFDHRSRITLLAACRGGAVLEESAALVVRNEFHGHILSRYRSTAEQG